MRFPSVAFLAAAATLAACSPTPETATATPRSDLASDGRSIAVGDSVSGVLSAQDPTWGGNGPFHLYRFRAREGDRLMVELKSDEFDPYLVVGDEASGIFSPIVEDDDGGAGLDARVRFVAPRTGSYGILTQSFGEYGAGSYVLTLIPAPEIRSAVQTPIAVGASVDGAITEDESYEEWGEVLLYDEYAFEADQGQRYLIEMSSDQIDPYLALGSGSGESFEQIAQNDDAGDDLDARIVFSPAASGTYTIRATSFDGTGVGGYTLALSLMPPPAPVVITPLRVDETLAGALAEDDQVTPEGAYYDVYSFSGAEGDRVRIVMHSDEFDSYLEVGTPPERGEEFWGDASDDDSGGGLDASVNVTLWRTGEYHVHALSLFPGETGSYTIRMDQLPPPGPPSVEQVEIGADVTGSLDPVDAIFEMGSHYDTYWFEARAGQRLRIVLSSDDFDSHLSFGPWHDGDIQVTDADDDGAGVYDTGSGLDAMLEVTLPRDGAYAVQASSYAADELGAYRLTIEPF